MAPVEGVRRIQVLGRNIALFGSAAGAALWTLVLVLRGSFGIAELVVMVALPLISGALVYLLGLVLQAFLEPPAEPK